MLNSKLLFLGWLAFGCLSPTGASEPVMISVDVGRIERQMAGGLGASWHAIENPIPVEGDRSHGGSAWGGNPTAEDDPAWRQIYRHADWLGLDFIRVEVEQRMYQPERDRFTWDSPEMRILYRILDWCEQRRADVFFQQMWGNVDWNAFPEFRGDAVKRVHSGPYSVEDFATGLAALMKHLIKVKRYTCIKWVCINNEPGYDWSWWQSPPNTPMPLRPGLAAARQALDRAGIKVPLSGPDWTDLPALKPEQIDFDEFIGAYDLHSYYARFDWHKAGGYPMAEALKRLAAWRQWASDRKKPLFLSELGTMIYGWRANHPGPSTYEAGIKDAELVVRALNAGVDGFNRWSFVNRGDLDGIWQMINTWDAQTKTVRNHITPCANAYFMYGLISRLTAKHSAVAPCMVDGAQIDGQDRLFAAALISPKGNLTWIVVNDAPREWAASFSLKRYRGNALFKYQVAGDLRAVANPRIAPAGKVDLRETGGLFTAVLPPMSLTIYTSYELAHEEPGITAE